MIALFAALLGGNLLVWACALAALGDRPLLLSTALLAYGLGLRHAVDVDHIAAIDNVTRKMLQEGRSPLGVGSFFAFGHSTVVVAAAIAAALAAGGLQQRYPALVEAGGVIGPAVSALSLLAIGTANLFVLRDAYRRFRQVRQDGCGPLAAAPQPGPVPRRLRRLFALVSRSWHMYPLGLLFGLGFDTATEIGLLGIAATEAAEGLPIWTILIFPALFTAGMTLVDATDGVLMLGAYGWALVEPERKLTYNLSVTGLSVFVALAIGGTEALGLAGGRLGLGGGFWEAVALACDNLGMVGYSIAALFALGWGVAFALHRMRGGDRQDAR